MANISSPITLLQPSGLDKKIYNWYISGSNVIIETIPEYLNRVTINRRFPAGLIAILVPKEGYTSLGSYSYSEFKNILVNFDCKLYHFVDGLDDENFVLYDPSVEIINDPDFINNIETIITNLIANMPVESFIEDREWGFADIVAGTTQEYDIDLIASWNYKIIGCSFVVNSSSLQVTMYINNYPVDGIVGTSVDSDIPYLNKLHVPAEVYAGDRVKITVSESVDEVTYLGGKIVTQRINLPESYIIVELTIPEGGAEVIFYSESLTINVDWENNGTIETMNVVNSNYSHTYTEGVHQSKFYTKNLDWEISSEYVTNIIEHLYQEAISLYNAKIPSLSIDDNQLLKYLYIDAPTTLLSVSIINCFRLRTIDLMGIFTVDDINSFLMDLTPEQYSLLESINIISPVNPTPSILDAFVLAHPNCTINISNP